MANPPFIVPTRQSYGRAQIAARPHKADGKQMIRSEGEAIQARAGSYYQIGHVGSVKQHRDEQTITAAWGKLQAMMGEGKFPPPAANYTLETIRYNPRFMGLDGDTTSVLAVEQVPSGPNSGTIIAFAPAAETLEHAVRCLAHELFRFHPTQGENHDLCYQYAQAAVRVYNGGRYNGPSVEVEEELAEQVERDRVEGLTQVASLTPMGIESPSVSAPTPSPRPDRQTVNEIQTPSSTPNRRPDQSADSRSGSEPNESGEDDLGNQRQGPSGPIYGSRTPPPTAANWGIDWDFIAEHEGRRRLDLYDPFEKGTEKQKSASISGATVATGVDLGQMSKEGLTSLLKSEPDLLEKLLPYANARGPKAAKFLAANPQLITDQEAQLLDEKVLSSTYRNLWQSIDDRRAEGLPKALSLPSHIKTVILSMAWNFGPNMIGNGLRKGFKYPKYIINHQWWELAQELRSGDWSGNLRRRKDEGEYLLAHGVTPRQPPGDQP